MPDPMDDPVTRVIDALMRHVSKTPTQVAQKRAQFDPQWDMALRAQQLDPRVMQAMKMYQPSSGGATMPPAIPLGPAERY